MKFNLSGKVLVILAIFLTPCLLVAQDDDLDFSEMSLEDLLNVEVVTASKQAESTWDAPAVITTVTKHEIAQFGGIQLREILERVTGITPNRGSGLYHAEATRGGDTNPDNANIHTLLLVNGRPIRESYNGSSNMIPMSVIPVSSIERIEIIRGPGSVLYGTNAFEGVINIITKREDANYIGLVARGGSDAGKNGELIANYHKEDFKFNLAINFLEEDGPSYNTVSYFGVPQNDDNDFQDNLGIMSSMEYNGFNATFYYADTDWNASSFGPGLFPLKSTAEQHMINLGYEYSFNDNWSFRVDGTRNNSEFSFLNDTRFPDGQDYFEISRNAKDTLFEATVFGKVNEKVGLLFGGTSENISGDSTTAEVGAYDEGRWSLYFQGEIKPNDRLKIVFGGQYNKIENLDGDFVPRIGVLFHFNESTGMKLLYGEAFRSPSKLQSDQDQNLGTGEVAAVGPNPGLEPEKIKTIDLQFYMNKDNYSAIFTIFKSDEEGLIRIDDNPDPLYQTWFANTGGRTIQGFEIEGKFIPSEKVYITGSYINNTSESDDNIDDITLAPDYAVKLGVSFIGDSTTFGIFGSLFDAYHDSVLIFPGRAVAGPESDSWSSLSANFTYHLKLDRMNIDFNLYGKNLTDETVYTPFTESGDTNTIATGLSPQIYASISTRF